MDRLPAQNVIDRIFGGPGAPAAGPPVPGTSPASPLTVTELNQQVRALVEGRYAQIWVAGEISNFSQPASGHWYFTLKDAAAQVAAVMFRTASRAVKFQPEEGMAVLALGRATVYAPRGSFQLVVEALEPHGVGAQEIALRQLKARLAAEGLFAAERKRALPRFPRGAAIITSPTGAAVQDIITTARRRFPAIRLMVIPAVVQGEQAAASIAAALAAVPEWVDVAIAGRGGGSAEDLGAFNTEVVARAIAACRVPVVSAVGHDTDITIADLVADARAATPTAAAALVVPDRDEILRGVRRAGDRLAAGMTNEHDTATRALERARARLRNPGILISNARLDAATAGQSLERTGRALATSRRAWVAALGARLLRQEPRRHLQELAARLEGVRARMPAAVLRQVGAAKARAASWRVALETLDPASVLQRGFALVSGADGRIVARAAGLREGTHLTLRFADGAVEALVTAGAPETKPE